MKDLVYFENNYGDTDERGNEFVCIDGFPADDNEEGRVVATVFLTPHNDIVVDWHDNGYRLDKTVLTLVDQAISNLKSSKEAQVEILQRIDDDHQYHYWYGGDVAKIEYKGLVFYVSARGDVITTLVDENGEELAYVKDKNNSGRFYSEMDAYIPDDKTLEEYIRNERLVVDNNNWFEVLIYDQNGGFHDPMWVLDASTLDEAVEECKAGLEEQITFLGEELPVFEDVRPCETISTRDVLRQLADAEFFLLSENSHKHFLIESEADCDVASVEFDDDGNATSLSFK